ncbi:CDP-glycerol glycerophosphotransferase family protein [Methanobrevibacter sp.]|uniref:CDP-glycerol glycerophosphotransferase family protein n=1 Tax=Methanobrevibacter sp. TaxID=66852 RepID=UPI003890A5D1
MGFKQKIRNLKDCKDNSSIYDLYYDNKIDENLIYVESRNGFDFTGNIFRIVEEISTGKYGDFRINVFANSSVKSKIQEYKRNYNLKIDKIITNEVEATKALERAKYIFTDSGIRPKYIKKEGQILVNTWHGTPLKLMGKDNPGEIISIGHIQHPLLSSDYLLYPNRYMCEKMTNAFMIEKCFPGKVLFEGYPRNSVFFDEARRDELKNSLGYGDKEIFCYMPTFRGKVGDRDDEKQKEDIEGFLSKIDSNLYDNQIMFVKLHAYNEAKIDFSKFNNIIKFPSGYETYDILNLADVLITDYSSVFFDFANTRRKIIIFNYDEDDYLSYRGFYFPLSELPFPKASSVDELIANLNTDIEYDDSDFVSEFCEFDNENAAANICEHILKGNKISSEQYIKNDKPNILIFGGSLMNNGITSSLINMLDNVDRDRYNFYLTFKQWDEYINENYDTVFDKIPEGVEFLPFRYNLTPTIEEKMDYNKYFTSNDMEYPKSLDNLFKRSFDKQYKILDFKAVIDFDGYNHNESMIFANSHVNNTIWVHNDMIQEAEKRNKQNLNILKEVYSKNNHVAVVSPGLIDSTAKISGRRDNIIVVHNINDYRSIIERSNEHVKVDDHTVVYNNDIEDVLKRPGKKFITIGRYSPEKGHERLLKAFDEFCERYEDSQLIIIGGHGVLYDDTVELVDSLNHSKNVTLIKDISNPMPILKQCDLFIVSSFYEGWPMVIMEADALDVPVLATDITACQWMKEYGGNITEDSQEGILNGLYEFMENGFRPLTIDYEEYNAQAIEEFYSIIEK